MILKGAKLYYPSARDWMWNYCVYLGSFTDSEGKLFDLGIYLNQETSSAAIVYGNEPGDYYSGDLKRFGRDDSVHSEIYKETRRRAYELGLINKSLL